MKTDWRVEAPQLAILIGMFVLALVTWPGAPDQIPVHWSGAGEVDRYGGKFEGLLLMPLIATGLYVLLRVLPRIDPGRANYAAFQNTYDLIRFGIMIVLAVLYGVVHLWIRGREVDMNTVIPMVVGAFFVVIGASMGKLRPNWFIGLRTPWTLSSKTAWVRTHRLGGWLFIALGLALMIAMPLVEPRFAFPLLAAGGAAVALWSMVYSYLVWRNDPDKVPPAGTTPAE